ncbi:MAG: PQQ-dependent sugar dehydrogenase [Hyphomicrobiaceae bacterium]
MKLKSLARLGALLMAVLPPSVRAEITNAPAEKPSKYNVEIVAKGLANPWALQFLPDGRMLVTERPGRLRIISADGKLSAPITGVPKVVARDQGGLLDVAVSPDFATTGTIFLSYSEPRDAMKNGTSVMRAKLILTAEGGSLQDGQVIFRQLPAAASNHHFGSRLVINPDGSLFVTLGDRYSQRDQAQNPANHIGKIVRIMQDGTPFAGNPKLPGWAPEVWSIGHRNVQGAALDPVTGTLWTTEHGARGGDELNNPQAGKNYGWPIISYGRDYTGEKIGIGTKKDGLEQPVYYWDPSIATSGLAFYTGHYSAWKNNAFAGGLAGMQIDRLVIRDGQVVAHEPLLAEKGWRIRDVRMGPGNALYALTDESNGAVLRITPTQ